MRRRTDPLPFSPQYSFACWRAFKYEGVDYINGDPFPAEGVEKPGASMLEKLYRQKMIVVAEAPAQPIGGVKAVSKADREAALAAPVESDQVEQAPLEDENDEPHTADAQADDAADNIGDRAAGGSEPAADADADGAGAAPDQPVGALKRHYRGFDGHDVVAENGYVVAKGIKSKDEADAIVAAGLPPK
jgi:hypothetical protein